MSNLTGVTNLRKHSGLHRAPGIAATILLAMALPFSGAQSTDPTSSAQATSPDTGTATPPDQKALLLRVQDLERELAQIKSLLQAQVPAPPPVSSPKPSAAAPLDAPEMATHPQSIPVNSAARHGFFEKKPGPDLTFYTPSGQFTLYGNLDVSVDSATKGSSSLIGPDGAGPIGNMGWLLDLSTNISYLGIRGKQKISSRFDFLYQMETEIDIASSAGVSESNSSESNVVKGALTSRNSFLGLGSAAAGSLLFGKTDAPYKLTTLRMNPFYGMLGDYAVIMGNTGGDNRVEFGTRLDHSLWWISPVKHGLGATVLFSPGQNRSSSSDNIASGESDCTGGDIPGSGGSLPFACNDGSFSNAVSASLTYTSKPLYLTAAYERHQKVNRSSDLTGEYANPPAGYMTADTADEDAAKVGAQFTLPSKTTLSAIFEDMHRYVPAILAFQNERQRLGTWIALTQVLSPRDSVSLGWAHAFRTPGDPGQHNTSTALPPGGSPGDGTGGLGVDNTANMISVAFRHKLSEGLTAYANWAGTFNGPYAHYDLGAGGRTVTVDCHDASDATGDETSDPHCWAGGHLQGLSLGLNRRF